MIEFHGKQAIALVFLICLCLSFFVVLIHQLLYPSPMRIFGNLGFRDIKFFYCKFIGKKRVDHACSDFAVALHEMGVVAEKLGNMKWATL